MHFIVINKGQPMRRFSYAIFAVFSILNFSFCYADEALVQRKDVQNFINMMVKQHQFKRPELVSVFEQVQLQPQIIESMERPFEKKNWDVYKQLFLTPQRVQGGIAFWQANQQILQKAEKQFGVPAHVIVAIIGVETLYGKNQGSYRVIDALSTLAFNYPKRSDFFSKELAEYFLLCREHHVTPTQYVGSYAGAMGKPQFMPSSYRNYAVDFSTNPKKDLMNDDKAVIASVANYFQRHGWITDEGIAQPAKISGTGYKHINTAYKSAAYSIKQLTSAGVQPLTAAFNPPDKAGLIELNTDQGSEFWLAYPNFYVITRYNSSPQYALAVYLLSQELKNQWVASNSAHKQFAFA